MSGTQTPDDVINKMVEMNRDGVTGMEIARRLKVSPTTVRHWLRKRKMAPQEAPPKTWTDERVEKLKELWKEGLSCSKIADCLGNGITKNAVIGKLSRIGLSGHGRAPLQTVTLAEKASARHIIPVSYDEPDMGEGKTLLDLKTAEVHAECRWPVDMKANLTNKELYATGPCNRFCGQPSKHVRDDATGPVFSSYCEHHHDRAYRPTGKVEI